MMTVALNRFAVQGTGALVLVLTLLAAPVIHAQDAPSPDSDDAPPTRIVVRAVSNDAKLLQDPVGGARITIRKADTGDVLAEGLQRGDSGSTDRIMREPHARGATIYDVPGAAHFDTTLALAEPTRVEVVAEGPLAYPHAMQRAATTLWLMPGRDVTGDGVVLTLHGFIVEVLQPTDAAATPGATLDIRARVRMLCGCPTAPGGMWDASTYRIRAELLQNGTVVADSPMDFSGTTSEYDATLAVPDDGATHLRVVVSDPARVNFGLRTVELDAE